MKKATITTFLILLACVLSIKPAIAQSYILKSLDGELVKIVLYYKPFSGVLSVDGPDGKFYINNYNGILKAEVVEGCFLKVLYSSAGGSNSVVNNLMILCVSKNKLCQAIHMNVYSGGVDVKTYKLNTKIVATNKSYKLWVGVIKTDYIQVGSTLKRHESKGNMLLEFDLANNCFCNTNTRFDKTYMVYDPKVRKQISRMISGELPGVIIDGDLWSIINNQWYSVDLKNRLMYQYSYKE